LRREILVSATPQESWVAILEDEQLVELMFDRPDRGRMVGDIYLGRVEAILPGIQAAFVDIGTEKAGFLHVSDLERDEDDDETNGDGRRNGGRRARKFPPFKSRSRRVRSCSSRSPKSPSPPKVRVSPRRSPSPVASWSTCPSPPTWG
jgi:ribonuclease G